MKASHPASAKRVPKVALRSFQISPSIPASRQAVFAASRNYELLHLDTRRERGKNPNRQIVLSNYEDKEMTADERLALIRLKLSGRNITSVIWKS